MASCSFITAKRARYTSASLHRHGGSEAESVRARASVCACEPLGNPAHGNPSQSGRCSLRLAVDAERLLFLADGCFARHALELLHGKRHDARFAGGRGPLQGRGAGSERHSRGGVTPWWAPGQTDPTAQRARPLTAMVLVCSPTKSVFTLSMMGSNSRVSGFFSWCSR